MSKARTSSLWIIALIIITLMTPGCVEKRQQSQTKIIPAEKPQNNFFSGKYIPDIETFMQIGYVGNADISHDGRRIFLVPSFTNARQLFRITDNGWPYQLTSFEDGISWYVLSHDFYYAIVGAAAGGDENNQLYLLDTETGRIKKLTERSEVRYGGVAWSRDDKTIYFFSNEGNMSDFWIYKMNLPDGKMELVHEKEGWNVPKQVTDDGLYLLYESSNSSTNNNYYLLNLQTKSEELLTPHEGDNLYSSLVLTPDYKAGYVNTNNTPDGIARLGKLDLQTKAITFLEPDQKWECEGSGLSRDGRYLIWILNEEGYSRPFVKDLAGKTMLPMPSLNGMYSIGGITDDGRILYTFNNANHPPEAWLWDPSRETGTRITQVSTMGIDINKFVEPRLIHYKSFDALEIPAFVYFPADYDGGPIPFIMDIHGGPEGQYRPNFSRHFNYLLANGFGVMAPNVRGSEGYGKAYLDMDNYTNRLNAVADAAAGAQWLIDSGYTTAKMLGVKGASYGGYMVMALITEYPELFAAAWNDVGIANFVTFLENTAPYRRPLRETEYGPLSDQEFLQSISPINKIARIKCPLMVVHGENDPRVPINEARQIISELKARGGEVDSLIFSDEGHGTTKLENRLAVYRKMVDFFGKHLKK